MNPFQKIQSLIDYSNAKTGGSASDLTSAVEALGDGYGQGGASLGNGKIKFTGAANAYYLGSNNYLSYAGTDGEIHSVAFPLPNGNTEVEIPKGSIVSLCLNALHVFPQNPELSILCYAGGLFKNMNWEQTRVGEYDFLMLDDELRVHILDCLAPSTLITLADGSEKPICKIKYDDMILGYNPHTMQLVPQRIVTCDSHMKKAHSEYDRWYLSDGTIIETVHRHRFYNVEAQRMKYMDEWKLGEHFTKKDGTFPTLVKHEHINEVSHHYTIFTEYNNYFANGCLSGNRYTRPLSLKMNE